MLGWQQSVSPSVSVANVVANKKRKAGKYKDPEARKKYMRELMQKRRAK